MAHAKVLVLGATGPAGICLLRELLHRNHATVAYVRNPSKIPEDLVGNALLEIIQGSMDLLPFTTALTTTKPKVILSLLGPNIKTDRGIPATTYPTIYSSTILPAMRTAQISRIYAMGTISIAQPLDKFSVFAALVRGIMSLFVGNLYRNMLGVAEVFEKSEGVEWTIFRVAQIPGGADAESWRREREGELFTGWVGERGWGSSVSRALLARWLVDAVEEGREEWVGKMPAVGRLG